MREARQRQLRGPKATAQRRGGLTQQRLDTGLGEDDRGGEPVGPGSYDDGVWRHA